MGSNSARHSDSGQLGDVRAVKQQQFSGKVDPLIWAVAIEIQESHFAAGRDGLLGALKDDGIECRNGFYSPNEMPMFDSHKSHSPVSDRLARNVLSLPTYIGLEREQVKRVCNAITKFDRPS